MDTAPKTAIGKMFVCASRDHNVASCPLKQTPAESKANPMVFKCFYCSGKNMAANHRASDLACLEEELLMRLMQRNDFQRSSVSAFDEIIASQLQKD